MLTSILGFFGSSAFGSIIGAVAAWLGKIEDRKNKALEYEHERSLLTLKNEQARLMFDKGIEKSVVDGEQRVAAIEAQAYEKAQAELSASLNSGTSRWDKVLRLFRPLLTTFLVGLSTYVAYHVTVLVGGMTAFSSAELLELFKYIVAEVFSLTGTAVSFWFCARGSSEKTLTILKRISRTAK